MSSVSWQKVLVTVEVLALNDSTNSAWGFRVCHVWRRREKRILSIKWLIPQVTQIIAQILLTISLHLLFPICICIIKKNLLLGLHSREYSFGWGFQNNLGVLLTIQIPRFYSPRFWFSWSGIESSHHFICSTSSNWVDFETHFEKHICKD